MKNALNVTIEIVFSAQMAAKIKCIFCQKKKKISLKGIFQMTEMLAFS